MNARIVSLAALLVVVPVLGLVLLTNRGGDPVVDTLDDIRDDTRDVTSALGAAPTTAEAVRVLPDRGLHPPLVEIDGWVQSEVSSLEELRGRVVAVQFWTFACSNCKATVPHLRQLYADHHDAGFEIVGVHAPEFAFEEDVDDIVEAAAELGITWPIALDTAKQTFHSWQEGSRAFWPRIYLLDRDGHVRYDHIGEGRYAEIEAAVEALLAEPTGAAVDG